MRRPHTAGESGTRAARRGFLAGVVAAAGALLAPRRGAATSHDPSPADPPASKGYRLTEHVKRYYRAARF